MFHVKQLCDLGSFCYSERSEKSCNVNDALEEYLKYIRYIYS